MGHSFTREELYAKVWTEPLKTLGPKIGVSDVALAKACRKADIPIPPRGYWAKKPAGKPVVRPNLPPRFPGGSNEVEIGRYYDTRLSDEEIIDSPLPPPPVFPEDLEALRGRVFKMAGKVEYPALTGRIHPLIGKLLQQEEKRRKEHESYSSSWYRAEYKPSVDKRELRILNAIFLATQKVGCKPYISTSKYAYDGRNPSVTVGEQHVGLKLERKTTKSRQKGKSSDSKDGLRLTISGWHGHKEEMRCWEDTDDTRIEKQLPDIVVEIILSGERQYRSAVTWSHEWRAKRKAEFIEERKRQLAEAERQARELKAKKEQARIDRLLAQAFALQQADTIRAYVASMRELSGDLPVSPDRFEAWATWALAQADRIDPSVNLAFLADLEETE